MIRQHNLLPGKVMLHRGEAEVTDIFGQRVKVERWRPCMIVGFVSDVKRRHAKSTAPIEGWDVLVLWFGNHKRLYDIFNITPLSKDWKSLW